MGNAFELYWSIAMNTRGMSPEAKCKWLVSFQLLVHFSCYIGVMMRKGVDVIEKIEATGTANTIAPVKNIQCSTRLLKFTRNEEEQTQIVDKMIALSEGDLSTFDDVALAVLLVAVG